MSSNLLPDVRNHFGLTALPFTREVSVDKLWKPANVHEALDELRTCVEQRMSAAVIAPAGTGKTVLLRALTDSLPEARYRVHYVKVTRLSARDFCREVATAVGATPAGYYGSLVRKIQERAQALMDQDALRPVIILDEAHDMRPEVLAILRVLTNFEMDSKLVVSIILAGQTDLKSLLRRDDLEAVSRRISLYLTLRLLSRDESRDYVAHRLRIVGADDAGIFDETALDAVYEMAQGNLRATDRLALKAMEMACRRSDPVVGVEHVAAARTKVAP
jgi:general secretion pathway protein A